MIVLGIESSCDETAVALIERGGSQRVLHQEIKSQVPLHARYGGIVPEIASRNHYEVIDLLVNKTLHASGCRRKEIDLLAVTQGPGLIGSLLVGLSFAKGWSFTDGIPLVGVDHLQAHVEAAHIENRNIEFPLIALVVSGGHTSVFYQKERFNSELIARTRDDAAGEVLDKAAKYFSLGYPGGPLLERIALAATDTPFSFSVPKMTDGSNDFSFSGYKTALFRLAAEKGISGDSNDFYALIASFVRAIADYLVEKTMTLAADCGCSSIIVSGGVSRNSLLREKFVQAANREGRKVYIPAPVYCTDNAAMVAWHGYEKFLAFPENNYHDLRLNSFSRAFGRRNRKHR